MTTDNEYDVLVSGGGPAGLTLALALAKTGLSVCVCAPATGIDRRTTALLNDSIEYLNSLGLEDAITQAAWPLKTMRLVDGTSRLFRIQQTDFRASEIGIEAFGYNIRNRDYLKSVADELAKLETINIINSRISSIETDEGGRITANLETATNGSKAVHGRFIVGADGKNSIVRSHFGHGERSWSYPQTAIVVDFTHEYSSNYTSTEFHTETGPFTIVPQSDRLAGLVWLEKPEYAEHVRQLPTEQVEQLLEEKMQSFLGRIKLKESVQTFPISGLTAKCFGDAHHVLIGEAAHVFPPIGAQGFNLGIRDIKELVSILGRADARENPGTPYHLARTRDINSRTAGVDMLNRSLLSGFLPMQIARSAGMFALKKVAPLRKRIMKLGISPVFHG